MKSRTITFNDFSAVAEASPFWATHEDRFYNVFYNGEKVGQIIQGWSRNGGYGWTYITPGKGYPASTSKTVKQTLANFASAYIRNIK